ncbi:MAG TPA: class I SAM-dependent methyltransferase [Myxococcaceae bacterium]|nr:class I SAM-dependent methyltransferase [Myxococcaceae bacterium]
MSQSTKDLAAIPVGHYHQVMERGNPIRRAWHLLKFQRVLDAFPPGPGLSLLDVGCFAGSLLSLADPTRFSRQLGVDILPEQIHFANANFRTPERQFQSIHRLQDLSALPETFDCVSAIELIEHVTPAEIDALFRGAARLLVPGTGAFVLSTPNYLSAWPLLEFGLNHFSDVDYSEQHITRFNRLTVKSKLRHMVPDLERWFRWDLVTTTHLLTPFAAPFLGVERACQLGASVPHSRWFMPFGSLILMRLTRTTEPV